MTAPKDIDAGRGRPVTLTEVAQMAGVSTATVSRVLNAPDQVAAKTAARVRAVVERTGYVPNLVAGGLASRRSRLISIVLPTITQSLFATTIQTMSDELANAGYNVLLGLSGSREDRLAEVADSLLGRRVDGLILTGPVEDPDIRARLQKSGLPVIETWDFPERPLDMVVGFSHEAVGAAVADYVADRGYRHPLLVSATSGRAKRRRQAFAHRFAELKRAPPGVMEFDAPATIRDGREALARALDAGDRPDLVVCASDLSALGVLMEAQRRGLSIPGDIGVIGFGNLDLAGDAAPALTTVAIDGAKIGREAVRLLLGRAGGAPREHATVDVGFRIVARESA